jgi:uncharacterized membrane-anchored protein YjiN (DUF445 family)
MPDDDASDSAGDDRQWASGDLASDGSAVPLPGRWPHAPYSSDTPEADLSLPEAKEATRDRARDLEALVTDAAARHWPSGDSGPARADAEPPRRTGLHARALPVLRAVPWALAALFAASFAWDFPRGTLRLFGHAWPLAGLLRAISVSGLIGFFTNWLAVTMLFRPREERPVFGQGLVPAQKERVVWRLSEAISEDLVNEQVVKEKIRRSGIVERYRAKVMQTTRAVLEDDAFRRELKGLAQGYARGVLRAPAVQKRLADFLIERLEAHAARGGLSGALLGAYRTLGEQDFRRRVDRFVRRLPESVEPALGRLDALLDRLPAHIEKRAGSLEDAATRLVLGFVENLDLRTMVRERMAAYDERKLERLFKKTSNEQLNYIKYLGGILGAVGGCVIWAPLPALAFFALVGCLLYLLDEALFRMSGE